LRPPVIIAAKPSAPGNARTSCAGAEELVAGLELEIGLELGNELELLLELELVAGLELEIGLELGNELELLLELTLELLDVDDTLDVDELLLELLLDAPIISPVVRLNITNPATPSVVEVDERVPLPLTTVSISVTPFSVC